MRGAHHGNRAHHTDDRRSLARPKAKRRPDEKWRAEKCPGIVSDSQMKQRPENHSRNEQRGYQKCGRFDELRLGPLPPWMAAPQKQERRENQRPGSVSQPPGAPDDAVLMPRRETAQSQARDAEGGSDGRAQNASVEGKTENVPGLIKHALTIGETQNQIRRSQGLQGVSCRDTERRERSPRRRQIDQERPHENRRPIPPIEKKKRGDGNARRRPERTRAWMHRGQAEAQLRGQDIRGQSGQADEQRFQELPTPHARLCFHKSPRCDTGSLPSDQARNAVKGVNLAGFSSGYGSSGHGFLPEARRAAVSGHI